MHLQSLKLLRLTVKKHVRIQEFSSGGPGQSDKKKALTLFFFVFFFTAYFTEVKWSIPKKSIIFKVPEGVQHFPGGGSNFFQGGGGGGVQLLIPYGNPYNL